MQKIITIAIVFFSFSATAQVKKISLQASGLTCSMCSNSINKSLKTIDFVDKIVSNIKTSTFEITLKPGSQPDFDVLKKKVEDAGFFVANLTAVVSFPKTEIKKDEHVSMHGMSFHFLNTGNKTIEGDKTIRILDKGFLPAKEFKKNQGLTKLDCYKTGVTASCCTKEGLQAGKRIYHISI